MATRLLKDRVIQNKALRLSAALLICEQHQFFALRRASWNVQVTAYQNIMVII